MFNPYIFILLICYIIRDFKGYLLFTYSPKNVLLHKKLSHEKRFYVSRLASRIHCLAFRVNPEAFRVNPLVFLSKRAAFRAMRKNCFEQSVREPYETFIRFHSELFDNLIVSKWRPYFTFLHIVSDWQNTCVCMLMKINLEKKSFNKIVLIFNKQKKGIKLTKDYL